MITGGTPSCAVTNVATFVGAVATVPSASAPVRLFGAGPGVAVPASAVQVTDPASTESVVVATQYTGVPAGRPMSEPDGGEVVLFVPQTTVCCASEVIRSLTTFSGDEPVGLVRPSCMNGRCTFAAF